MSRIRIGLFLVLALTIVSLIHVRMASAVTYNAGVVVGNSFTYQASTYWNTSSSPFAAFQGVSSYTVQITKIASPRVNATLTYTFANGTASKTAFLEGDLSSGGGNLTFILIPAGLNGGDTFPFMGSLVTLNSSSTVTTLGVSRVADFLNYSISGRGYSFREGLVWDRTTGALIDVSFYESVASPGGHGGLNVFLSGTNVWTSYILGLPPAIFYTIIGVFALVVVIICLNILRRGASPPRAAPSQPAGNPPPVGP